MPPSEPPSGSRLQREYAKGHTLFVEGDSAELMYVLQSGAVDIVKEVAGDRRVLATLGPGEFFGEMALLNNKPRTATAVIAEDARLLAIDQKTFEAMVIKNSEIATRLVRKLAARLDGAVSLIDVLMHQDPSARTVSGLLREAREQTVSEFGVLVAKTPEQFGDQFGLDTIDVEEALKRLSRLGIVEVVEDGIRIRELSKLQEFGDFIERRDEHEASEWI